MKIAAKSAMWLLALAVTVVPTRSLFAQEAQEEASIQAREQTNHTYGTTAYSEAPDLSEATTAAITVKPILVEGKASYATGGISLRNRGAGNISISGLVGPPRIVLLYWAVITMGAPGTADKTIQIERLSPVPASAVTTVTGVTVGTGPAPCWGPKGAIITVFRARVAVAVANGNGSYQLTLAPGAGGLINGADPWVGTPALPLFEGASLVLIGSGVGTVSVFDSGLAGKTFAPNPSPFNYVLALPVPASSRGMMLDNIGADGQHVFTASRLAQASQSDETTTINGVPIAGQGSQYIDSDWNGSAGLPEPELWDDTGHVITKAAQDGQLSLNISINSALGPADCLTPVANIVEED